MPKRKNHSQRPGQKGRPAAQNPRAQRPQGYDEQVLSFESARQRQAQAQHQPPRQNAPQRPPLQSQNAARGRPDNSIPFPTQQARRPGQQRPGTPPRPNPGPRPQGGRPAGAAQGGQRLRPAQSPTRSPLQREQRKRRRLTRAEVRRRRLMRRLATLALLLCVIVAGGYLTVTMLFKINAIEVRTADGTVVQEVGGYSSAQILQALGVQKDENIFSFRPAEKAAALERQFPLLESITVIRNYPNTVVVRVTEASPTYTLQTQAGWLTLSGQFKILSLQAAQPGLPSLYGGEPVSSTPGEQLAFAAPAVPAQSGSAASDSAAPAADGRMQALSTLIEALSEHGLLADTSRIEFANTEQLAFLYQNRVSVLLGTLNGLDYKLDFAVYLLHNVDGKGCAETDTGALDCSHMRSDGTLRPILAQGEPKLPSGYVVPPAPAEPAPAEAEPQAEPPAADAPAPPPTAEAQPESPAAQPQTEPASAPPEAPPQQ